MMSSPIVLWLAQVARHKWSWAVASVLVSATTAFALASWLAGVKFPEVAPSAQSSEVFAADGQRIATLHGEENRRIVPLNAISQHLLSAVLSAEDQDFFEHNGTSIKAIIRAAGANLLGGEIQQGGSTITQQYVRNALPDIGKEKRLARKLKEAFWAIQLERYYPKGQIIERYMNTVYFGRGAYGAEAAARTYFKVSADKLTLGQAAYLAGLIRAPERFQVDEDPKGAVNLRNVVLEGMLDGGRIDERQAGAAKKEDLLADFKPGQTVEVDSPKAGYFVEYVRRLLKSEFQLSDAEILRGGLQIHTTLDPRMQDAAEAAVSAVLNRPDDPEAALVAMGPKGEVKAMVGGRDVGSVGRARGFNFAADVNETGGGRQAGSAFKPFALAAFVAEGKSLESTFPGTSPLTIESRRCRNQDGTAWEVANFEEAQYQSVNVTAATLSSVNTVYAQIMDKVVTPSKFIKVAKDAGIEVPRTDAGCALALGTSDVTPLEMARAYTTFGQRGMRPDPIVITKIMRPNGQIIAERFTNVQQALERNVADTVNYVLAQNIQGGTGNKAKIGRPAAGKTGTTQNHQNAWFAGYTPELTAVVWMGYAPGEDGKIKEMTDVRGEKVTGGGLPANIWKRFMTAANKGIPVSSFKRPVLKGEVLNFGPQPQATLAEGGEKAPAGTDMIPAAATEEVPDQAAVDGLDEEETSGSQIEEETPKETKESKPSRQENPEPSPPPGTMKPCFPFCDE
jgi:membrane peptidoglycan carboxypeptidase